MTKELIRFDFWAVNPSHSGAQPRQAKPSKAAPLGGSEGSERLPDARGKGFGAPKGADNAAWKHGGWTDEAVSLRRAAGRLLRALNTE